MIKIIIIILFLFALHIEARAQNPEDSIHLLETILRPKSDTIPFAYADRIDDYFIDRLKKAISRLRLSGYNVQTHKKDYIVLTKSEKAYILAQAEKFRKPYWQDGLFPNSKVFPLDTLHKFLRDTTGQGRLFLGVNYGRRHSQFTKPIFFRSNMFMIQYTVMWGNIDCATDVLAIYRNNNRIWQRWLWIEGGYY